MPDPDAITVREALVIAGISVGTAQRCRREGLLTRLPDRTTYSRREAEQLAQDPWLSGVKAATILSVSHARVTQLASKDKIPYREGNSGKTFYRRSQPEVVANARDTQKFGIQIDRCLLAGPGGTTLLCREDEVARSIRPTRYFTAAYPLRLQ